MSLDNFIDIEQFVAEVDGELSDISEAMRTQTARTAYYGMKHASAKKQLSKQKLLLASVEATLSKKFREEFEAAARDEVEGTNKAPARVTSEMINSAVHVDPNYIKWAQTLIDAEEIETICKVAYNAFKTREEMLKSLGHLTGAQLKSNIQLQNAKSVASNSRDRHAARMREQQQDSTAG